MAKAELKTKKNEASVEKFLAGVDEKQRADSIAIVEMMKKITKQEPKMWGTSIIGFGEWHYVGKSGREGDWFVVGFSPRKQNLTLYLTVGGMEMHKDLLKKLGKHKIGSGCLYINKLADVDLGVLKEMIKRSATRKK